MDKGIDLEKVYHNVTPNTSFLWRIITIMNKYDKQLQDLQESFNLKKEELKIKSRESNAHNIPVIERETAEILHENLCKHNHTDGCGWFYDNGDWTEYSRKIYLEMARRLLAHFRKDQIYLFLSLMKK